MSTSIISGETWKQSSYILASRWRYCVAYLTAIVTNILGHDDTEAVEGPGLPHGAHLQPGQGGGVKPVDGGVVFPGEGGEASSV